MVLLRALSCSFGISPLNRLVYQGEQLLLFHPSMIWRAIKALHCRWNVYTARFYWIGSSLLMLKTMAEWLKSVCITEDCRWVEINDNQIGGYGGEYKWFSMITYYWHDEDDGDDDGYKLHVSHLFWWRFILTLPGGDRSMGNRLKLKIIQIKQKHHSRCHWNQISSQNLGRQCKYSQNCTKCKYALSIEFCNDLNDI